MIRKHAGNGLGACVAAALVSLASPAVAQQIPGKPNAERGARLAADLCIECHVPTAEDGKPVNSDIPTFKEIANLKGRTPEWITGKIMIPAHPMPNLALSRADIADLVAYILSFRKPK